MICDLDKVTKVLHRQKVLNEITVKFEYGKIYGIYGHNGSGKTMLLRTICGLMKPSSGRLYISEGVEFGVIIENPEFISNQSGLFNLKYLAGINRYIDESQIVDTLKLVGLESAMNVLVKRYSLGMKQKLAIAQAIMEKPDLLLLDEPFNALDETSVENIILILKEYIKDNKTIILVSHQKDILQELCDEMYVMNDGRLSLKV